MSYGWFDDNPQTGDNYYRVKAVNRAGEIRYTSIVKVLIEKGEPGISVHPNPLEKNVIGLQLINMNKGIYNLSLYNSQGQQVFYTQLSYDGSAGTRQIPIGNMIANGVYELVVEGEGVKRVVKVGIN